MTFSSQDEYESMDEAECSDNSGSPRSNSQGAGYSSKPETIVKCCFENQRYWVVSGWSAMMGGALERASWSDAKGLVYLPKESVKLEKGYRWAGGW